MPFSHQHNIQIAVYGFVYQRVSVYVGIGLGMQAILKVVM